MHKNIRILFMYTWNIMYRFASTKSTYSFISFVSKCKFEYSVISYINFETISLFTNHKHKSRLLNNLRIKWRVREHLWRKYFYYFCCFSRKPLYMKDVLNLFWIIVAIICLYFNLYVKRVVLNLIMESRQ